MRICVNIVRETVRMVTQCQNQTQPKLTMIEQLHPSNKSAPLNTPACAVKPTSLLPITAATGIPARPPKNSDHPAVAVPMILKTRYHTLVGINPAAIKRSAYRTLGDTHRAADREHPAHVDDQALFCYEKTRVREKCRFILPLFPCTDHREY